MSEEVDDRGGKTRTLRGAGEKNGMLEGGCRRFNPPGTFTLTRCEDRVPSDAIRFVAAGPGGNGGMA